MRPMLREKLRLQDLRLIDAVAREGTLVGAARRLAQSQPATTKALQSVEALLNVRLFDRTPRGVSPTRSGALLTETANRVIREMEALDQALADARHGRRHVLNIGAETGSADAILMAALSSMSSSQSDLQFRVVEGGCERLMDDLSEGRVDLVVGRLIERSSDDAFFARALYDEPIALMARAGHSIFRCAEPERADFSQFQVLVSERSGQVADEVDAFIRERLPTSRRSVRSSSAALVKEMVHITDCLVVGPATFLAGDIARGDVKVIAAGTTLSPRPAGYIRRRDGSLPEGADVFLEALTGSAPRIAELVSPSAAV